MLELDEALIRFQQRGAEYGPGFANHGPMAAEALLRLGHGALLIGLVDIYAPRLPPCGVGAPIPEGELAAALGDPARIDDWRATFQEALAGREWGDVLRDALPARVEGLFAAATHGLLRTAHAVRALEDEPGPVREAELAWGLAFWSARLQALPGVPGARAERDRGPAEVLASIVPSARAAASTKAGELLSEAVRVLDDDASFVEAIERFDPDALPFEEALSDLCSAAAGLYLRHRPARVAYAHCVTAPAALRLLAPWLDPETRRRALGAALQAVAALHAVSAGQAGGGDAAVDEDELERLAVEPAEMRYRAACSLEVHAIKLTEACLREDRIAPDPRLRLAAADAALHLDEGNRGRVT